MNDQQVRIAALNPRESFLIQAPAGSGKTELLTQRYLSLLSQACENPEEIIAITFTRKAAAEMRQRVLTAINLAENPNSPGLPDHRIEAWKLAQAVLRKDQTFGWNLLENPQRLRILTIDSLCSQLSHQLPLLSGYGISPKIVDDPIPYYRQATLEFIQKNPPVELLSHLDNNVEKIMLLCIELLGKREQWLPYIIGHGGNSDLRRQLENNLQRLAEETLSITNRQFNQDTTEQLLTLLSFAANNLPHHTHHRSLLLWKNLTAFPSPIAGQLECWRGLANALLTNEGQWRKKITIDHGFPAKTQPKKQFEALLKNFSDNKILLNALQQIAICPPIHYPDDQWKILIALIELLPMLTAQLQLIFQEQGVIDFIELGFSAARALGEEQQPTDLALALDYQIKHLLIDEFQDTSIAQYQLLGKLIAGWEPGDGRTIFLVGDPMQSIYRFRNAEVSLFLKAAQQGFYQIPLQTMTLSFNFRSHKNLIDWFNQIFPKLLPPASDMTNGAIPYSQSVAAAKEQTISSKSVNSYHCLDDQSEAQGIAQMIRQIQQLTPQDNIAILVRNRSHLFKIIPILQQENISFQAIEIDSLNQRPEIQDLLALTRVLLHRGDRIAWLAMLRSPYCGLTLADLHLIAQSARDKLILEVLVGFDQLQNLSEDGRLRLQRIVPALQQSLDQQGRLSFWAWLESTWVSLGGPATLSNSQELANVEAYFKLLMKLSSEQSFISIELILPQLKKSYATPLQVNNRLQIMTIHKAKGLEFDHVILPQLHRLPPNEKNRLLLWLERTDSLGKPQLLLAPIHETGSELDLIYQYLKKVEQQKLSFEAERLLYVAVTRAKTTLHLTAVTKDFITNPEWQPPANSFLAMLWHYFRDQLDDQLKNEAGFALQNIEQPLSKPNFRRLKNSWVFPQINNKRLSISDIVSISPVTETTIGSQASRVGIVIHEAMADLANQAPDFSQPFCEPKWVYRLKQLGSTAEEINDSIKLVHQAVHQTLQDPRGLWILSAQHQDRKNEYALTACSEQQTYSIVIDRTFIANDGTRWIIDYKTGNFSEQDLIQHYPQLTRYAKIMSMKESRPIQLGIYYPLSSHWHEFEFKKVLLG